MKNACLLVLRVALPVLMAASVVAAGPPPIESVAIQKRAFVVNGKPFFPLMGWLQDARNFPALRECGMNATAGYWNGSSGTRNVREYTDLVAKAGLYAVMPYDAALKGHAALLGYIHDDEPDLDRQVNDADVAPGPGMKLNNSTPLWKIVDGVTHSWSVLDPMEGGAVTVRLKAAVTAMSVAVHVTVSPGLAAPKDVAFDADGKEVLRAALEARKGPQKFELKAPATFQSLTLRVLTARPDKNAWGSIGEIEAFDAAGRNVLLSPPRRVPRSTPEQTLEHFYRVKQGDPERPLFMTLTANFHPFFDKWAEPQRRQMYPAYAQAADVVGYDVYPIYGWNKPEWLHLAYDCTRALVEIAGPGRPVYAWIETSKGGQWTGDLARQKDVTPAHIRAEVWMSITAGATAIGYFTHVWKPSYSQFGVPPENVKAIREVNEQIARLAPALLADPAPRKASIEPAPAQDAGAKPVKLAILARQASDGLYLFCVNYDERARAARANIRVEGLPAGTKVEVVDEARTVVSSAGTFADDFAPLAVHIYRVR